MLDGSLYPGVVSTHEELRGCGPDDYTILFTARPPSMCQNLTQTLARIAGPEDRPRLSILPGAGMKAGIKNVTQIMMNDYHRLGDKKLQRFREYAQLFPDAVGRTVFIGDDGQADLDISDELLAATHPETGQHYFAFIAIHAVSQRTTTPLPSMKEHDRVTEEKRAKYPPLPSAMGRHRFFYFVDYNDLADQLCESHWLSAESKKRIQTASLKETVCAEHFTTEQREELFCNPSTSPRPSPRGAAKCASSSTAGYPS